MFIWSVNKSFDSIRYIQQILFSFFWTHFVKVYLDIDWHKWMHTNIFNLKTLIRTKTFINFTVWTKVQNIRQSIFLTHYFNQNTKRLNCQNFRFYLNKMLVNSLLTFSLSLSLSLSLSPILLNYKLYKILSQVFNLLNEKQQ
jgi:hypothetical protein